MRTPSGLPRGIGDDGGPRQRTPRRRDARRVVRLLAGRPGEHQITSIDDDTGPTLLHARPDARYWIHQEVSALAGDLHAHLDFVDEPTALEMLERIDTRVLLSVRGHEDEDDAMAIVPAR